MFRGGSYIDQDGFNDLLRNKPGYYNPMDTSDIEGAQPRRLFLNRTEK
jgi:hypothetical protein